jgi:1,4-alpha-glucan branching enzyme
MMACAFYWLEMGVDGLRFDAVAPMLFRNGRAQKPAIDFLKRLNAAVHDRFPQALMIAEDTGSVPNVAVPLEREGLGFDAKVAVYFQMRMRSYFACCYPYRSKEWEHGKLLEILSGLMGGEQWISAHSHDDAGYNNSHGGVNLYQSLPTQDLWRRFADMRLFHAVNIFFPGAGHMIHMGDEIGQTQPWNQRLFDREGAVQWHLLSKPGQEGDFHRALLTYVGDLHGLYRSQPCLWRHEGRGFHRISDYAGNAVLGFHRTDHQGNRLAIFFNFSTMGFPEYKFPISSTEQDPELNWVIGADEIFNSDGVQYGGTGQFQNRWAYISRDAHNRPDQFHFSFPPLSVLVFREKWTL